MKGCVTFLIALPVAAGAQSVAERAMLSAWDDSVQQAATTTALTALDSPSRRGSGRAGDLRRSLFLVRQADLTDSRPDIELVLTNMQVLANHTNWAWPHYVMARAFMVMARKQWIETLSDGKQLAEKHSDAVWRTLRMALDRDNGFPSARRLLGELTAAGGDRFLRPDQVVALHREVRQREPDPDALLAWGRHLRTLQDYMHAIEEFNRAEERGGDRSRLDLERSRTLLAAGDTTGAVDLYWSGIAHLSAAGRQLYRSDLWWIAEPEELTAFDETPDALIEPWLRRFWNARDAEAANHRGDRLIEHLRRWVVVYERYRALSPWTDAFWSRVEIGFDLVRCFAKEGLGPVAVAPDPRLYQQLWRRPPTVDGDLRLREPLIDHRGMIYFRHGEPTRIITSGGRGGAPVPRRSLTDPYTPAPRATGPTGVLLPWSTRAMGEVPATSDNPTSESWMYWWDGEVRLLHFRGSAALGGYAATTLTEATPAGLVNETRISSSLPIAEYYALATRIKSWNDSSPFGPNGPRNAPKDDPRCFNEAKAVVARTTRDENASVNRDSDTPPSFAGQNSVGQVFALGTAADQSGEVLTTFAIPRGILRPEPLDDGRIGYTIAWRIVAYDKAANRSITLDTVRQLVAPLALTPREFVTGYTELGLPAGTWQVATRATQVGGAVVLQDLHFARVDAGTGLTLSDIVTGRPGHPVWAATDGLPFPVNYPNGWYSGETAELFYEVRGVPDGQSYQTVVEVRPAAGKSAAAIRIQSTDRASGDVVRVRKTLGLEQLVPGKYVVAVTVTYLGRSAVREREILIVAGP